MVRKGARHSVTISFPPLPCPIHHLSSGLVRPGGELAGNELSVLSSSPLLHCVLVGGNELSVLSYRPLCPAESQHWPVTCSIWGQDTNTCNTYVILPPTSEKYGQFGWRKLSCCRGQSSLPLIQCMQYASCGGEMWFDIVAMVVSP